MYSPLRVLPVILIPLLISCTGSKTLVEPATEYVKSSADIKNILQELPDYSNTLLGAKGKGRAIVSEPGSSDHVTVYFESNRKTSLLTFKNRLGIEGGAILVEQDSMLIYYKTEKIAQKASVRDGRLTSLNELASVNLLDLLNFTLSEDEVLEVWESEKDYLLRLLNNGGVTVSKSEHVITSVKQPYSSGLPYSQIIYENYGTLDGYLVPRKITIFSIDGNSKVVFQVRTLVLNPEHLNPTLTIPSNILIERL